MNDYSHIDSRSDLVILKQIGTFVKQTRITQNITQADLSIRAAMSRSTLSLMERGENISLVNLIKILRILDVLYVLDELKVSPQVRPLQLAREAAKKRKRAYKGASSTADAAAEEDLGW